MLLKRAQARNENNICTDIYLSNSIYIFARSNNQTELENITSHRMRDRASYDQFCICIHMYTRAYVTYSIRLQCMMMMHVVSTNGAARAILSHCTILKRANRKCAKCVRATTTLYCCNYMANSRAKHAAAETLHMDGRDNIPPNISVVHITQHETTSTALLHRQRAVFT